MSKTEENEAAWAYFMDPSNVSSELAAKLKIQFGGENILTRKVVPTAITSDREIHIEDIRDSLRAIDTRIHQIFRALDELEEKT